MGSRIKVFDAGNLDYDGSQIKPLWAFSTLGVQGDSIVIFRGAMKLARKEVLDQKDLRESSDNYPISGDEALHLIVEHFDDPDLRLAYHRQRILIFLIKEMLESKAGHDMVRKASDLYIGDRKLTVSVATASVSSSKIHVGINITGTGAPKGVEIIGLEDIGLEDISSFGSSVAKAYIHELEEIEEDLTKTRVF